MVLVFFVFTRNQTIELRQDKVIYINNVQHQPPVIGFAYKIYLSGSWLVSLPLDQYKPTHSALCFIINTLDSFQTLIVLLHALHNTWDQRLYFPSERTKQWLSVLLMDTSVSAGHDSNLHSADQKHQSLNSMLLTARPRHFHTVGWLVVDKYQYSLLVYLNIA